MKWISDIVRNEEGYSLVESLVAMAILLTVLVPSTMFLTYIGNNVLAKDKITSFNHARNQMEYILATQNDSTLTKQIDSNWWVKQSVVKERNLREIKVEVFKNDTLSDPMITLQTARLWYSEN
ncbi:MAG: type II secretion system protein [Balneolaceae bacterium]|nr:type II secretion system protein [Balneolaceae bacterium]